MLKSVNNEISEGLISLNIKLKRAIFDLVYFSEKEMVRRKHTPTKVDLIVIVNVDRSTPQVKTSMGRKTGSLTRWSWRNERRHLKTNGRTNYLIQNL